MDALFSYSKGKSFIHRTPAWLKLLMLIAVPVTVSLTPLYVCLALMAIFALLVLASGIGFTRFLRDMKPIAVYCIMIVLIDVLSYVFFDRSRSVVTQNSLNLILRLLCAMEASSVFFRTTGTYEITTTLQAIEKAVTFGHSNLAVSGMLSLFLSFLPQIFRTWSDIDCAYRSRGGKSGLSKVVRLLPVLITASMKKASVTYMALLDRN